MIFISVNTPIKKNGLGAGETSDLRWVESCARQIGEVAENHTIIVEKSTLPVRTAQTIKDILLSGGVFMNVVMNKRIAEMHEVNSVDVFPSCGDETKIHDSFCVVFKTKIHPGDFPSPNTILTKIKSRCHERTFVCEKVKDF